MRADAALIQIVDAAVAEAFRRAPAHIECKRGCSHCCIGPFPVTLHDLARLRARATPRIAARAAEARLAMRENFPGDFETGAIAADSGAFEEARKWLPCPVLDLETGACELHEHRPIACRLHGPALRLNGEIVRHCRLNYSALSAGTIEALRVELHLPEDAPEQPLTYIAWAFTNSPTG
ncbi:MAG: YkgJ family cysteine cluster protein [Acidobacteria bacterium]|nr:YkgJ family cysteine cluster protein [Acidobacteriota bacterium]